MTDHGVPRPNDVWPDIQNGNHAEARTERRNQLNDMRSRVEEWQKIMAQHPQGGPSRVEMSGIVSNLKCFLDQIDPGEVT